MSLPPPAPRPRVLAILAGLGGGDGNGAAVMARARAHLEVEAELETLVLRDGGSFEEHRPQLARAEAFVFVTGTYWDSWSSLLQRFLEEATSSEGTDLWLGKPAAVIVTAHSVGGKGVVSRLQGVLVTMGAGIPPMSGIVIALATELAIEHSPAEQTQDLWRADDLEIVCHNLLEAARGGRAFKSWPVDRDATRGRWFGVSVSTKR